jgi:D-amino-acid oxidase
MFTEPRPDPWWRAALPRPLERPAPDSLPAPYVDGYRFMGIVIDTSIYMDYLVSSFAQLGGEIVQREVNSLEEALGESRLVVNCCGLGARELCDDEELVPVRGQMLRVRPQGLDAVILDDEGPNSLGLLVPRRADLMLGGTTQAGDWNTEPREEDRAEILRKAKAMWPELGEVEVLDEVVGLRPVRRAVRLEAEEFERGVVVHNYGHGGAGFTLSWGCARDVVGLVLDTRQSRV